MKFLHWLLLRWRADRLRTLASNAFARGRRLSRKADEVDARAAALDENDSERAR